MSAHDTHVPRFLVIKIGGASYNIHRGASVSEVTTTVHSGSTVSEYRFLNRVLLYQWVDAVPPTTHWYKLTFCATENLLERS